jgi:hypothetical protein
MNDERIYPADYTLEEWLILRSGWRDTRGDTLVWFRAQKSALGPNLPSGHYDAVYDSPGDIEHVVIFALCRLDDGNKVCYPFQTGTASKLEALGMVEAYKGNLLK